MCVLTPEILPPEWVGTNDNTAITTLLFTESKDTYEGNITNIDPRGLHVAKSAGFTLVCDEIYNNLNETRTGNALKLCGVMFSSKAEFYQSLAVVFKGYDACE